MLSSPDGTFVAEPSAPGPGVLVVHDWFGLLPHVRRTCEALAEDGFVAVAPDLYEGAMTTDPAQAEALLTALDEPAALERLSRDVEALRGDPRVAGSKVAAVGFSMGGSIVLRLAEMGAVDAAVAYYASLQPGARVSRPILLHLAERDDWDPPDMPQRFAGQLEEQGTAVVATTYAATEHSFANEDVPAFEPEAAGLAWRITTAFLEFVLARELPPSPEELREMVRRFCAPTTP